MSPLDVRARLTVRLAVLALGATVVGCSLLSPSPSPSPTPVPTPTPSPTPRPTPVFTPTPTPSPTPVPLNTSLLNRRITVLFAGSDSTPIRVQNGYGPLTDSMVVASVNAAHSELAMVALPRDAVDIPLGNGATWHLKVNAIRDSYGMEGLERALEATYGVPIDYWVEMNMPDLPRLVDALGGVFVDVPHAIRDSQVALNIGPGWQRINGNTALAYSRSRYTDSDYARAARQMQVLVALASRIENLGDRISVDALLALLTTLRTNAPLTDLPTLLRIVAESADAKTTATVLAPPRFALYAGIDAAGGRGWVMVANVPAMRSYVRGLMTD